MGKRLTCVGRLMAGLCLIAWGSLSAAETLPPYETADPALRVVTLPDGSGGENLRLRLMRTPLLLMA